MIQIAVDTPMLRRANSGSITGPIFVRMNDAVFPSAGWSDFPVVVLGWWMDAARRLLRGHSVVEELDFMDGPHLLTIRRDSEDTIQIECCTERGARLVIHQALVAASAFENELVGAAQAVADFCDRRGWIGADVDALQNAVAAFKVQPRAHPEEGQSP